MYEQQTNQSVKRPNSKRRWAIAGIGTVLAAGLISMQAFGNAEGHHGHHRHGKWAQMSPEQADKRIDKMVNRMLDDVGATADQKQRVAQIAKDAAKELMPLRAKHHAARGRAADILAQPSIDRNAIEQLRVEELQLGETASKRFTQALADAAEVLTPEQRVRLAAKWKKRHG